MKGPLSCLNVGPLIFQVDLHSVQACGVGVQGCLEGVGCEDLSTWPIWNNVVVLPEVRYFVFKYLRNGSSCLCLYNKSNRLTTLVLNAKGTGGLGHGVSALCSKLSSVIR